MWKSNCLVGQRSKASTPAGRAEKYNCLKTSETTTRWTRGKCSLCAKVPWNALNVTVNLSRSYKHMQGTKRDSGQVLTTPRQRIEIYPPCLDQPLQSWILINGMGKGDRGVHGIIPGGGVLEVPKGISSFSEAFKIWYGDVKILKWCYEGYNVKFLGAIYLNYATNTCVPILQL